MSTQQQAARATSEDRPASDFEAVYRANVSGITAFFARRCNEPQTVADLTSDTIASGAPSGTTTTGS
jgi:hypothetical protein